MSTIGFEALLAREAVRAEGARHGLRRSYPALADSVPEARRTLVAFARAAGAEGEQLDAIRLAVSEALTNVVRHAYWTHLGHIHVTARLSGSAVWVRIADTGCGLHSSPASDGLGMGLMLIAQLTDGFSIAERSSGGTELQLRFDLTDDATAPCFATALP